MAGKYRRPSTPEQRAKAEEAREAKLAALHETLTEQVAALASGPQWRAWLETAARFHNYSFNNTVLLLAQKRDATQVAGYNLWQELGRQVAKGEKGLMILAPVTRRVENTTTTSTEPEASTSTARPPAADDTNGREPAAESRRRVVGFRPAYVWDISSTTGDPLPTPPMPQLLAGHAPAGLWDALTAQCEAAGFTVTRAPIDGEAGPNGYTTYATREVVVRSDVDDAQAVKTLAHELGHVLMHDPANFTDGQTGSCRGAREVEAESVAFLVAADHGLDTGEYTFAYVAGWAAQTGDVNAALAASGTRVLGTAHQVLDTSHAHLATSTEPATTAASVVDAEQLAGRALVGADRADTLRATAASPPAAETAPSRERLLAANAAAMDYFRAQYPESWAPAYLTDRLGTAHLETANPPRVGYAPPGWTTLTEHLRGQRFSDDDILGAGLGTRASTGRVVDRFRDRLMLPIRSAAEQDGGAVVGFVGRRNPAQDTPTDARNPKYLNTAQTSLYTKGEHLFGLAEGRAALDRGGLAVVVEGPIDALAVDVASGGMMSGLAPLGTALTDTHAAQLRTALGAGSDRVVVATDADPAGQQAAARAYTQLTGHRLDPRATVLPAGLDPASTAQLHGPAVLVEAVVTAEPMGRQLVEATLAGRTLGLPEEKVTAARDAGAILQQAPADTWLREIEAVSIQTGLDAGMLRTSVVEAIPVTDTDALGRASGRDRRDDLDRGQHLPPTAADIAARSTRATHRPAPATSPRSRPEPVTAAAAASYRTGAVRR